MTQLLINGRDVLIDDEDLIRVNEYKWYINNYGYAVHRRRGISLLMHRFILNYTGNLTIDHINHNPLDNRKENLRIVGQHEQQLNRKSGLQTNNTSGYTGVRFNPKRGWEAYIQRHGEKTHLGFFDNQEAAIDARKKAEGSKEEGKI